MVDEFLRYGMPKIRVLTGTLQIILSIIMLYGFYDSRFIFFSSLLFVIMMSVAVFVRLKIKDNLKSFLPALLYLIINSIILYIFLYENNQIAFSY